MKETAQTLAERVLDGDRRALARAITLVESTRDDHREDAGRLVDLLLPHTGNSIRIGVSGAPGVGKSVFIEAFGLHLTRLGHKVAVLAVDPSSARSGGSILGDKTRMDALAREPNAYIRPSPSGGALGGVARRTREAMLVCEAAGFDVVIVETVGVGQSETEVDQMVDVFVLLVAPAAGDELQGIKRGVMELVDVLVVTKADGDLLATARQTLADHQHALHMLRPKRPRWTPRALTTSALRNEGIAEVWDAIQQVGSSPDVRARQAVTWFRAEVRDRLLQSVDQELATELERAVADGTMTPGAAADRLLGALGQLRQGDVADGE